MAETDRSLALRVQAHLRAAGRPVPALPDILPLIPTGLEELAGVIAANKLRYEELRVTPAFQLPVVNGEASIATLLTAPYRLLLDYLKQADVRDEDGNKLYYLGRDRYEMSQPLQYGYFTFEGATLFARLAGEQPGESDFDASLSANFVPAADTLPASCVPDSVLVIAQLLSALESRR